MADSVPMKMVIDCEKSGAPPVELADAVEQEAFDLFRSGDIENAQRVLNQAHDVRAQATAEPAEQMVPLEGEELDEYHARLNAPPPPPPGPTPIELLNADIQRATGLQDVQKAFAKFADAHPGFVP